MAGNEGFQDLFYSAPDGLRLHARIYGAELDGEAVVCLPGFAGTCREFHQLALRLSAGTGVRRKVIAFDYRGRGESAYDRDWRNYEVAVETGDIVAGLIVAGIPHGYFIGTSRGGLIIHALAAIRPTLLRAAVLNDVGPVVEGEGLAHIRSYLERAPKPKSFAEAVAIQRSAHGPAFPALGQEDWEHLTMAYYRNCDQAPVADHDPALVRKIRHLDLGRALPALWAHFEGLARVPVLAIRGENSKFLTAETLAEMGRRHPDCETVTVKGQGHAPLLETGDLPERISTFLDRAGVSPR
jgi:pimeloyl-ACP methyl ester carboxylesterase